MGSNFFGVVLLIHSKCCIQMRLDKSSARLCQWLCAALWLAVCTGCDEAPPFPQVAVDFTIDLNDPQYRQLQAIGNVVTVLGGSRGVLVKRTGLDSFVAFDQHCPFDADDAQARVSLEAGSIDFAQCAACQTRYNLYFGNPEEGPGRRPLLAYRCTYYPNSELLRIKN